MRFAQQGCALNAEQVFRRLATCAVEDVGIGNLLAVGMALAAMGNRSMRTSGAPDELAAYLAYILAISPKSRLACDLISIADYDRDLVPLKVHLSQADMALLGHCLTDKARSLPDRIVAGWFLAGTARFGGVTMPKVSRDRKELMRLMAASRMPLALYYIADRTAARLGDAMFVSMPIIAELVDHQPRMTVEHRPFTNDSMIAGYPAAAFDLHTHEGRNALRRFGQQCAPIARLLTSLTPTMRDTAIRHAVFIAEGGNLAEQITFAAAAEIKKQAERVELAFGGVRTEQQKALIAAVNLNLDALNALRRSLMSAPL